MQIYIFVIVIIFLKFQEAESWEEVLNRIGLFWWHLQVPDENAQISPSQHFRLPVDCVAELPGTLHICFTALHDELTVFYLQDWKSLICSLRNSLFSSRDTLSLIKQFCSDIKEKESG